MEGRIRKLSYGTASRLYEGTRQRYVEAPCARCGKTAEVIMKGGLLPPNIVARKFRELGWDFDPYRPRACVCPQCKGETVAYERDQLRKELSHHPMGKTVIGSGGRKLRKLRTAELKEALAVAEAALAKKPKQIEKQAEKVVAATGVVPVPNVEEREKLPMAEIAQIVPVKPRTLTAAERTGVRKLLDSHFLDEEGRYIDGYNDQRIGEEVGVPWALVTAMRETAYGPLRADPRVDQLRRELVDLRERVGKTQTQINATIEDLAKRITSAEAKLAEIDL